ncbi:hypothetical protein [Streptomyces sp. NPDC050485]|uniref:hypothetical protein n=1 Tax=Streptomyces sp. NPDC050485 TaxID=3365617 RepID=UPI00378C7B7A
MPTYAASRRRTARPLPGRRRSTGVPGYAASPCRTARPSPARRRSMGFARYSIRAAVATAAVAGALLTPAAAFAAGPTAPTAGGAAKGCTVTRDASIGAGTDAVLTLGPNGPAVTFKDGPGNPVPSLGKLDRNHPKLPASAGIYAEILHPYSTAPQLKTKVEGGPRAPYAIQDFPKLPKGCKPAPAVNSTTPAR